MVGKCALTLGLWVGLSVLAAGQFLIVPKGERAGSVTPKAVKAEMHAYGAYGTARIEVSFATDPNWANEVDFMMRLPDNSEATGFAYWFGDEYVVAKTVEKERAAQIYEFITSRQRDPALVELVGRRQFRVRIAPIDRSKDLRVEIKLVLKRTHGALALPLTALFHSRLESADLTVTAPDGWRENWGREGTLENGRRTYRFESKPWTAKSDWRIAPPPTPVIASVGRPAQGEGTMLVSYTAPRAEKVQLTAPKGVLVHVYPRQATLMAGETVTFAARIGANAPDSAALAIGSFKWQQSLPKQPFADRAAVVLWGADHVNTLKDRDQIRQWGMWLGIPTKETSWLAVPKAEEAALKSARFEVGARQYWLILSRYGKDSKQAQAELKKVRNLFRDADPRFKTDQQVDANMNWRLENAAYDVFNLLTQQYGRAVAKHGRSSAAAKGFAAGVRNIKASDRIYWYRQIPVDDVLVDAINSQINERMDVLLGYWGDRDPEKFNARDSELIRLWSALNPAQRKQVGLPYRLNEGLQMAERLRLGLPVEKTPELRRFAADAVRLAPIFGNVSKLRGDARASIAHYSLTEVARAWFGDRQKPRTTMPIEGRVAELDRWLRKFELTRSQAKESLIEIVGMDRMRAQPDDPDPTKPLLSADQQRFIQHFRLDPLEVMRDIYEYEYRDAAAHWAGLHYQVRQNPADLTKARAALDAWARALELKPPTKPEEVRYRGSGDEARDAYVLALRRHGANHPTTLAAKLAMEASDRRNGRPNRAELRAEILRLGYELDNLSYRTLTPEETAQRDELERRQRELYARMGDPLLIVNAPPTASVSARLPDGRLVELTWSTRALRWEHRFDLPPGSSEGTVLIPVWIRTAGGQVESRIERIHVDQTAPEMKVEWTRTESGWQVRVITEAAVARVNVALPDGRRLVLARLMVEGQVAIWQVEIEGDIQGEAVVIATDAAHNRTEVRRSFSP